MNRILLSATAEKNDPEWLAVPDVKSLASLPADKFEETVAAFGFLLPSQKNHIRANVTAAQQEKMLQQQSAFIYPKFLDNHALEWARHNLSRYVQDLRFSFSSPGKTRLIPHTDRSRCYLMIYLIDSGGDQVDTVFYKRKNSNQLICAPDSYDDYNNLEEIHRIRIPERTWTLINTSVLHSIENITRSRVAFHASFGEFPSDCELKDPFYSIDSVVDQ